MTKNCCRCFTVSLVPVASLLLAITFALGILMLPILYSLAVKDHMYGAVIDAGSSHTTLHIYTWRVPTKFSTTGEVQELFFCPTNHSNSTSVNSYTVNPKEVANAFSACLNESYKTAYEEYWVVPGQRQYTPLYLGATAGMRLVQLENPAVSGEIMGNITQALNESQYKFGGAVILNGSTEASSAWISANHEHLYNDRVSHCGYSCTQAPFRSNGSLDLGGASVQITFESNETSDYLLQESLFGVDYQLYARSLLCYGENEAHSRYLAYLISQHDGAASVPNPCLFNGATVTVNSSAIYTVCVNSPTAASVFGHSLTPPTDLKSDSPVTFKGTGNSYLCAQQVETVFSNFCTLERNCVNKTFSPPPVSGSFLGFSGFFHSAKFFNSSTRSFSRSSGWGSYHGNLSNFCNVSYEEAKRQYSKDQYLNIRCFVGQFSLFLLDGFGFKTSAPNNWTVQFVNKVDGKSLSWALGYIMDKSNNISQVHYYKEHPFQPVDLAVGMVILAILCVIFVVFFVITFHACKKALSARNGYQSI